MKKLLLSLCVIGLVGCSQAENDVIVEAINNEPVKILDENSVKLSNLDDLGNSAASLEFDWEYDVAEKYGTQGFKAIKYCYDKHLSKLDGVDTSSDFGAIKQGEVMTLIEACSYNSLVYTSIIPEDKRTKIPRDEQANYGLELDLSEEAGFDDIPPEAAATMDRNSDRYKELHKTCTENNSYYAGEPVAMAEAVEFCVSKGM